jgi:hypothetical protein
MVVEDRKAPRYLVVEKMAEFHNFPWCLVVNVVEGHNAPLYLVAGTAIDSHNILFYSVVNSVVEDRKCLWNFVLDLGAEGLGTSC